MKAWWEYTTGGGANAGIQKGRSQVECGGIQQDKREAGAGAGADRERQRDGQIAVSRRNIRTKCLVRKRC